MVVRINATRPVYSRKLVWENNDFSGGRNTENSNVPTDDTQGTIYLNADFSYTTFFHKRGGFSQVKLSENEAFLTDATYDVSVVYLYNGLEEYNSEVSGWKIRPHQFIVIEKRHKSDGNANIIRELLYFDATVKEYKNVKYTPLKLTQDTLTYSFEANFKASNLTLAQKRKIWDNNENSSTRENTLNALLRPYEHSWSKDESFIIFKLGNQSDTTLKNVAWTFDKSKKPYENDEIKILKNKERLFIKISASDILGESAFFLKQKLVGDIEKFSQNQPYYTSVKEEEVIGWNLALTFWKYLETSEQTSFKNLIKWQVKDSTINRVSNIMNSQFTLFDKDDTIDQESYGGLRTNNSFMMPGNKIFNPAIEMSDATLAENFLYWKDTSQIIPRTSPSDDNNGNWENYLNLKYTNKEGQTREGKAIIGDGTNTYAYENMETYSSESKEWKSAYESFLGRLSAYDRGQLTSARKTRLFKFLYKTFDGKTNFRDGNEKILYGLFNMKGIQSIISKEPKKLSFITRAEETYELGFSQDKALWDAQWVALEQEDKAHVDSGDLTALMETSNIFKWNNFFGFLTDSRLFFSMPQNPNYIPHNFDYTPPLEEENDVLQNVSTFYDQLILFSRYKIFKFVGISPSIESKERMVLKDLNNTIGAFSKYSIQRATNKIVFLSKGGVRTLTRTYEGQDTINTKIIDDQVADILSQLSEEDKWARSTYFNGNYYLYVPSKNQFFISNIKGETTNEKNSWIMWDSDLIDKENGKYFIDFYSNYNTNELFLLIGGKLYLKSKDQWYDGAPNANDNDKVLYNATYQSTELELDRDFHQKKIKNIKVLAYVPEKKGATLYVDAWGDGFQILSSKREKVVLQSGVETVELVEEPNLSYDAGSWLNVEGAVDKSRVGYDKTPMQSIRVSAKKVGNVKIRIRNRSDKEFTLKAIGVEFKYKKAK